MNDRFGQLMNTRSFVCRSCRKSGTRHTDRYMDNLNRVVICFDCVQKLDTPPLDTSDVAAIAAVIISQGERITKLEQQIKELYEKTNQR